MNFYISDLHLFHKNVTRAGKDFDDRPFEDLEDMHSVIKEKWNAKVTNGDTVYILGDMAMRGTQEELIAFVSTLKGHKIIIRGNHDDIRNLRYEQLFDEICDYKEINDTLNGENVRLVLCHYPILMWKNQHYGSILLYGHVHNSIEEYYFKKCLREMNNEEFFDRRSGTKILRAYNVGCMMPYMDYEPRTLSEIVENYEEFTTKVVRERKNYKGENIPLNEWKIKIQEDFPFMEQDPSDKGNIYRKYGFEFAGGWYDILRECLEAIVARYAEDGIGLAEIDFVPCQLKEKFGTLRFYYGYTDEHCVNAALDFLNAGLTMRFKPNDEDEGDDVKTKRRKDIRTIVSTAEQKSKCTCEMCGAEGKLRNNSDIGIYRVKTLCDSCHEKRIKIMQQEKLSKI